MAHLKACEYSSVHYIDFVQHFDTFMLITFPLFGESILCPFCPNSFLLNKIRSHNYILNIFYLNETDIARFLYVLTPTNHSCTARVIRSHTSPLRNAINSQSQHRTRNSLKNYVDGNLYYRPFGKNRVFLWCCFPGFVLFFLCHA